MESPDTADHARERVTFHRAELRRLNDSAHKNSDYLARSAALSITTAGLVLAGIGAARGHPADQQAIALGGAALTALFLVIELALVRSMRIIVRLSDERYQRMVDDFQLSSLPRASWDVGDDLNNTWPTLLGGLTITKALVIVSVMMTWVSVNPAMLTTLQIGSAILGSASAVFFYIAGHHLEWKFQTGSGESVGEVEHRRRAKVYGSLGLTALFLSFMAQLAAILWKD